MFTELLPDTKAQKPVKRVIEWQSLARMGVVAGGLEVLGVLAITVGKKAARYVVSKVPTRWAGNAYRMSKPADEAGTDENERDYDCFVAADPRLSRCDCRGFCRHGHCKHLDALIALAENDQLDPSPSNPEADTGDTEPTYPTPEEFGF